MGRITGIQWYYQIMLLLFLFLTIYSFVFVSKFAEDECLKKVEEDETNEEETAEPEPTTSLVVMPGIMGFVYISECGLTFLMVVLIYYFSNLDISKFASLGFCQRLLGKFTKCIPYLIILAHLVLFVLILAQVFLVFVIRDCEDAEHTDPQEGTTEKGVMQDEGEIYTLVTSIGWICMHACGGFFRRNVYYDAFFYEPEMSAGKLKNWCCIRCGP